MSWLRYREVYIPTLDCKSSNETWGFNFCSPEDPNTSFLGCCGVEACSAKCPKDQLLPASLPQDETYRDGFLNIDERGASSTSGLVPTATSPPINDFTFPAALIQDQDRGSQITIGPAAVAGICVGVLTIALLLLGVSWGYWYVLF